MRRSDHPSSANLARPIRRPETGRRVLTVLLVSVMLLFATCRGTSTPAKDTKLDDTTDIGHAGMRHRFGLAKLEHAVAAILKDQTDVSRERTVTNNQVSVNNITQGLVLNSPVNVWYCSNNPGTGIQFTSVEIEDYPIQKGITAYYEFQGIGRYNFRLGGAVVILSIPTTGAQVMQISVGDPYSVHQGYLVDYWFGLQFPNYVPPGSYNVNILFIDIYGSIRECIYFPTRF